MIDLTVNDYFKSPSLDLCATLAYFGYQIDAVDTNNPSRVVFHILRDKKLDDLIQAYWQHELRVDPLAYFGVLKELKSRIYNG